MVDGQIIDYSVSRGRAQIRVIGCRKNGANYTIRRFDGVDIREALASLEQYDHNIIFRFIRGEVAKWYLNPSNLLAIERREFKRVIRNHNELVDTV